MSHDKENPNYYENEVLRARGVSWRYAVDGVYSHAMTCTDFKNLLIEVDFKAEPVSTQVIFEQLVFGEIRGTATH